MKILLFANRTIPHPILLRCLTCFFLLTPVFAGEAELAKLSDNAYARIASPDGVAVANAGFLILDHSVLVFDTHFTPEAGEELLAAIRSVTSKPVRYVVNSHYHADHTHGNQAFPDAQLISSVNARRDILQIDLPSLNRTISVTRTQLVKLRQELAKSTNSSQTDRLREQIKIREDYLQNMSKLRIVAPSIVLEDSLIIQEGKQEVRILFLGTGHTDGDIILFMPGQKISFVGDLLFNKAIPNVQDAKILEWMETLREVLKLDADTFLSGHGPIAGKKDVEDFLLYFEELKMMVQASVDRGDSLEQATKGIQIPEKYGSYRFQNFFPSNVQKMFAELKAQQPAPMTPEDPAIAEPKYPKKKK